MKNRRRWQPEALASAASTILSMALIGAPSGCAAGKGEAPLPGDGPGPGTDTNTGAVPTYVPGLIPQEPDCEGSVEVTIRKLGYPLAADDADPGLDDECVETLDWTAPPVAELPDPDPPPATETFECPAGSTRLHVRDVWSSLASPPLNRFPERPVTVQVVDVTGQVMTGSQFGARVESVGCDWYSVCLPPELTRFGLTAVGPGECATDQGVSGTFDLGELTGASDVWIDFVGPTLTSNEYGYYGGTVVVGPAGFRVTATRADVEALLCSPGDPPTETPAGHTRLHVRWFWGDPTETGYPGTACGESILGVSTPPYPSSLSLKVNGGSCTIPATLEFQNGDCPWYSALIPNDQWTGTVQVIYGKDGPGGLSSPPVDLPPRDHDEFWLAYTGAPDNLSSQGTPCNNFSNRKNVYVFFPGNPGPGYTSCGGEGDVVVDPCNPPVPAGYQTVHVRYIWAGQKTFTFFPRPDLMPAWLVFEVNGGGGDKDIICFREADRPWYNCPVPDAEFFPGATWRLVDKTHTPEWNTVMPRDNFPATPGEYWLRWNYGKPDIPLEPTMTENAANGPLTNPEQFKFYDYYPDGTNGDWSATADWNDAACAPKPPPTPPAVGFGGWFPYDETGYAYPFGSSLARVYERADEVQSLLNAFVHERYVYWRDKYVEPHALGCDPDTARVKTNIGMTVSEGQGYGIAMAAAIGDRPTFEQLWRFTRHYLSQSAEKYCGGLMGWNWDDASPCMPLDTPATPGQSSGNQDSAFDGDVDIAIGLVFAARQWPEFVPAALDWLLKMECEVNTVYDGVFFYPTPGDTFDKNCAEYPGKPCSYTPGNDGRVNLSYYPPGYFRVFGDFLAAHLDPTAYADAEREEHRRFWYRTAETVYELFERCYQDPAIDPALVNDWGRYSAPCSEGGNNYDWPRSLWRTSIDAAWFGNRTDLPENQPNSSHAFPGKTRMQAKIEAIQGFFAEFHRNNPPEPNANRFSTLCDGLRPDGAVTGCDPAFGHNSNFVNNPLTAFVVAWDNGGDTTPAIRREALEESVSTAVINDRYFQESLGVYSLLFVTGNFPNPLEVP